MHIHQFILLFITIFEIVLFCSASSSCRSIPPHQYPNYPIHPDCAVGEYCSESMKQCVLITEHPKWGANCSRNILLSAWVCADNSNENSMETSNTNGALSWLEGDLECIHHKCYQCEEGSRNFSNGMICLRNQWRFERSSSFFENYTDLVFKRDTTSIILIVSMVLFFVSTIIGLFIDCYKIKSSKTEIKVLEEEMIKDNHFMKFYEKKLEKEKSKRLKKLKEKKKAMEDAPFFSSEDEKVEETETNEEEIVRNEHFSESDGEGLSSRKDKSIGNDLSNEERKIERISRPLPLNPRQRKHLEFLEKLQKEQEESRNESNIIPNEIVANPTKKGEVRNFKNSRNGNSNIHKANQNIDDEY